LQVLPKQINSSSALPCPLVSRPVSRQSRLKTLVFLGETGGFAAEVVGFELSERFFNARGLIDSGESAYQPIQKLTDP